MKSAPVTRRVLGCALFASALSAVAACSIAEIPNGSGPGNTGNQENAATTGSDCSNADPASSSGGSAGATFEKVEDLGTLAKCACTAGGSAHCYEKAASASQSVKDALASCGESGGLCVPDSILQGKMPATCKVAGGQGRCLSVCIKKVEEGLELLGRGDDKECAEDERCAPCTHPSTGKSTGICEMAASVAGKTTGGACVPSGGGTGEVVGQTPQGEPIQCPYTGTPKDVSEFPQCAIGGRCVKESTIDALVTDPGKLAQLKKQLAVCEADKGLCVPEEYLKAYGQYLPKTCHSFAKIEGRCMSVAFKNVNESKEILPIDVCADNERCLPCFNPDTGAPTGVCSTVSCDKATETMPVLQTCCRLGGEPQGKCIPRSDVPTQFQSRLERNGCGSADLCVPNDNLNPDKDPVFCQAGGGGKGVCVNDCVDFGLLGNLILERGTCQTNQTCVPCVDPLGSPTGAPGCN